MGVDQSQNWQGQHHAIWGVWGICFSCFREPCNNYYTKLLFSLTIKTYYPCRCVLPSCLDAFCALSSPCPSSRVRFPTNPYFGQQLGIRPMSSVEERVKVFPPRRLPTTALSAGIHSIACDLPRPAQIPCRNLTPPNFPSRAVFPSTTKTNPTVGSTVLPLCRL